MLWSSMTCTHLQQEGPQRGQDYGKCCRVHRMQEGNCYMTHHYRLWVPHCSHTPRHTRMDIALILMHLRVAQYLQSLSLSLYLSVSLSLPLSLSVSHSFSLTTHTTHSSLIELMNMVMYVMIMEIFRRRLTVLSSRWFSTVTGMGRCGPSPW